MTQFLDLRDLEWSSALSHTLNQTWPHMSSVIMGIGNDVNENRTHTRNLIEVSHVEWRSLNYAFSYGVILIVRSNSNLLKFNTIMLNRSVWLCTPTKEVWCNISMWTNSKRFFCSHFCHWCRKPKNTNALEECISIAQKCIPTDIWQDGRAELM